MNTDEFVTILREHAMNTAATGVEAVLNAPPGRKPSLELLELSAWYHSLTEHDRNMLMRVLNMTAYQAIFGVLAILDGARTIDDGAEKSTFSLIHRKGDVECDLIASSIESLHDTFAESVLKPSS